MRSLIHTRQCLQLPAIVLLTMLLPFASGSEVHADEAPKLALATTVSPLDGVEQPLLYWAPESASSQATPLLIFLHSWSSDYRQDNTKWLVECAQRNWIWVHPDFRGINQTPKACGSKFARQDILDALKFARQKWNVDGRRVYLAGVSGGGHMSLLMAAHHPQLFTAVSSWVPPTDLIEWHRFHTKDGKPERYAQMIEASLSGPPGTSPAVDDDYRDRSPVFHLQNVSDLPVSILAGVQDGHSGSVPVSHSLIAFNRIAAAHGNPLVSDGEIEQLRVQKMLTNPLASDLMEDEVLGRKIHLHRTSRSSSVTIFEGGHESIPAAAFNWLEQHQRETSSP